MKIIVFWLVSGLAAVMAVSASAQTPAGANAVRGEKLYYAHGCYTCHGYNGIGKHNIANNASPLLADEAAFLIYLRARGDLNPLLPTQRMPHFPEESLSDNAARDILAHIRTFRDQPPPASESPALNAILEGAALAVDSGN